MPKKKIDAEAPSPIADVDIPTFQEKRKRGRPKKGLKPRDTVRSLRLQLMLARMQALDDVTAERGKAGKLTDHLRALTHLYHAHRKYAQALAPFLDVGVFSYGLFP